MGEAQDEENQWLRDMLVKRSTQAQRDSEEGGETDEAMILDDTLGVPVASSDPDMATAEECMSDKAGIAISSESGEVRDEVGLDCPGAFAIGPGSTEPGGGGDTPQVEPVLANPAPPVDATPLLVVANLVQDSEQAPVFLPNASQVDLDQDRSKKRAFQRNALQGTACMIVGGLILIGLVVGMVIGLDNATATTAPTLLDPVSLAPSDYILSLLPEYTLEAIQNGDLHGVATAQSLALDWLMADSNLEDYSDQRILQRYAMATLYLSTNGEEWRDNDSWLLHSAHECEWFIQPSYSKVNLLDDDMFFDYRIGDSAGEDPCDSERNLRHLWLSELGLKGSIPPELALLKSLQTIDLMSNDLTGTVPTHLAQLSHLEVLWLYSKGLTGTIPTEFGVMSSIVHLEVMDTSITGTIPTEIGLLSSTLEALVFDNNLIAGPIPTQFGLLSKLTGLGLGADLLTGAIPSQLGLLHATLRDACIYENVFTSHLPTELGLFSDMRFFVFFANHLTGPIPSELGLLSAAAYFTLADNAFSGTIPRELGQLSNTTQYFELDANQLTGTIPTQLGQLAMVQYLRLNGNQLIGPLPSQLGVLEELKDLSLQDNALTGSIPKNWTSSNALKDLRLSNNRLTESLPSEMGLWGNLTVLLLDHNSFTGTLPQELVSLVPNSTLRTIDVQSNNLTGTLADDLCVLVTSELLYCNVQRCGQFLGFDCSSDGGDSGLCGCGCVCL